MQPIGMPFFQYFDNDGTPLEDGSIYFGTVNLNPETNPISIYWDALLTQPAAQPIKTLNGFIVRDGVMAQLFCNSDYSFTVRNKKGVIVTSAKDSADSAFGVISAQLAAATAAVAAIGTSIQSQLWVGFTTSGSSGAYVLNPLPALTGYISDPWNLNVKFHTNGNGTDTIDVNGLGAKNIKQYDSSGNKVAPVIKAGMRTDLIYDGTDWVIIDALPPAVTPNGRSFFSASGNWTCPTSVTVAWITGIGSGGGGGGATAGAGGGAGGGGSSGAATFKTQVNVTPGTVYPVVIGAAGGGGGTSSSGFNGNACSACGILLAGGNGGSGAGLGATGAGGTSAGTNSGAGEKGILVNAGFYKGGNGGGSIFASPSFGAHVDTLGATHAVSGGGYGSGGGGGAGGAAGILGNAVAGTTGFILIEW